MFIYPETQTEVMIISRTYFTLNYIMGMKTSVWRVNLNMGAWTFLSNAGTVLHCSTKCILSNCHRFEQSPLGIIVTRLFNTRRHYQLLRDDFAKISRNGKVLNRTSPIVYSQLWFFQRVLKKLMHNNFKGSNKPQWIMISVKMQNDNYNELFPESMLSQ